jgi:MFS family permease
MLVSAAVMVVATALSAAVLTYPVLATSRFVLGMGLGADFAVMLPYVGELAPKLSRGALMVLVMWVGDLGQLLAYGSGFVVSGETAIRLVLAFGGVFLLPTLWFRLRMPESPRWSGPSLVRTISRELARNNRAALTRSAAPWFLHQFSAQGLGVFLPLLLVALGSGSGHLGSVGTKALSLVAAIFTIRLVESWGRRPLQIWGFSLRGLALVFLGAGVIVSTSLPAYWSLSLVGIVMAAGAFGPDKTTVVVAAEVLGTGVRTTGQGVCETIGRLGGALGVFVVGLLLADGQLALAILLMGAAALAGAWVSYRWTPETRGEELPETRKGATTSAAVGLTQ